MRISVRTDHPVAADSLDHTAPRGAALDNSRNRRFFPVRHSVMSERSPRDSRLSVMRRDLGGGRYVMMKITAVRIFIQGRRWGRASIAYILP